ncbi:MAG: hypothetical protein LH481_06005 [Burkholderiales bacterium]|nr:hypothetical protein [Burkholderiales bacterium]
MTYLKHKHWRTSQAEKLPKAAPALDFYQFSPLCQPISTCGLPEVISMILRDEGAFGFSGKPDFL